MRVLAKIMTVSLFAAALGGCQSVGGQVGDGAKSRLSAAGFQPAEAGAEAGTLPNMSIDGFYVCETGACAPHVALVFTTMRVTPPEGAAGTIESGVTSRAIDSEAMKRALQSAEARRSSDRTIYDSVAVDQGNLRVSVTAHRGSGAQRLYATGSFKIIGNTLRGGLVVGPSKRVVDQHSQLTFLH